VLSFVGLLGFSPPTGISSIPAATKLASPKTFWNLKLFGSPGIVRYSRRCEGKAIPGRLREKKEDVISTENVAT